MLRELEALRLAKSVMRRVRSPTDGDSGCGTTLCLHPELKQLLCLGSALVSHLALFPTPCPTLPFFSFSADYTPNHCSLVFVSLGVTKCTPVLSLTLFLVSVTSCVSVLFIFPDLSFRLPVLCVCVCHVYVCVVCYVWVV